MCLLQNRPLPPRWLRPRLHFSLVFKTYVTGTPSPHTFAHGLPEPLSSTCVCIAPTPATGRSSLFLLPDCCSCYVPSRDLTTTTCLSRTVCLGRNKTQHLCVGLASPWVPSRTDQGEHNLITWSKHRLQPRNPPKEKALWPTRFVLAKWPLVFKFDFNLGYRKWALIRIVKAIISWRS